MATTIGNSGDNDLIGTINDDLILGLGGNDTLSGGAGNDKLFGGKGDDSIVGGDGKDRIRAGNGNDSVDGGDGNDTIYGGNGSDSIDGGSGSDVIYGDNGNGRNDHDDDDDRDDDDDDDHGDDRNDTIYGGDGNDKIYGGSGNDSLIGGSGADQLSGGSGRDHFVYLLATDSPESAGWDCILDFTQGRDKIDLAAFRNNSADLDLIWKGEDPAIPGPWGVWYHNDPTSTYVYADTSGDGIADLRIELKNTPGLDLLVTDFIGVAEAPVNENVVGTPGADLIVTGAGNDTVDGGAGDDAIDAGAGDDEITPGPGNDTVTGGPGADSFFHHGAIDGLDTLLDFNRTEDIGTLHLTGAAGEYTYDPAANALTHAVGGYGVVFGGTSTAPDEVPFDGTETFFSATGDATPPRLGELRSADAANVAGTTGSDLLLLFGTANGLTASGGDGDDRILDLSTGGNTLAGDGGADTLDGGAGNDTIKGGAGADSLVGGADTDTLLYDDSPSQVIVNMRNSGSVIVGADTVLAGTARDGFGTTDTISGIENVVGSAFDDYIQGPSNLANRFEGGAGNDTLAGSGVSESIPGAMDDTLLGGAGDDVLRQTRGHDSIDGGADFDRLEFTDTGIPYGGTTGVNVNLATGFSDADPNDGDPVNPTGGDVAAVSGIEHVLGTAGADILTGNAFANRLEGQGGNDTIKGGAGADSLAGGADTDTLLYNDSPSRVIVNMLNTGSVIVGADTVLAGTARDGFGTTDTISGFETVVGSAFNDFLQGSTNVVNQLEGGAGNDTLVGSGMSDSNPEAIDDTLLGGVGDDELRQTRGADHLDGGAGNDRLAFLNPSGTSTTGITYVGATGVNVDLEAGTSDYDTSDAGNPLGTLVSIENVTGTAGNDSFMGGDSSHAPNLLGNAVLESFRPLGGNDTITGATGNGFITRADYSTSTSAVAVNLGEGTASDGFGGTDTLVRVDQAFGGSGNDTLLGGSQERSNAGIFLEQFRGGAGNDEINGAGTDTVVGAAGTNQVRYSDSPAAVIVNLGATDFVAGMVTVQGGTARDGFIADTVTGAQFTDTLLNINSVLGSNFNDTLVGGASDHRLIGGPGNDLLVGGTSGVEASYNNGTTAVNVNLATGFVSDGQGGSDTLVNIDDLRGSIFNDTLTGNAASNRILGDPGADTIDGGDGIDFASYLSTSLANGGINAFIENGAGLVNDGFGLGSDTLSNIEGLIGTHSNDTLAGGLGDQWFIGRGGSDVINGGDGSDGVSYINDPAGVTVNLGAPGSATDGWGGVVWALGGIDTLISIENVEGSSFNDSITGDAFANRLEGQGGNDTLEGGGGNDTVDGGAGDDLIIGGDGAGNDTYQGGDGIDTVSYASTSQGVTASLASGTATGVEIGTDTLIAIENVIGGTGGDTLTGDAFANLLDGGAGNDTIKGGVGADLLAGGADTDTLSYNDSPSRVIVNMLNTGSVILGGDTVLAGTARDGFGTTDTISGFETVVGSAFSDFLQGSTNVVNRLEGGAGNDTLVGSGMSDSIPGAIDDTLLGGSGDDELRQTRGADHIDGGTGFDRLAFTTPGAASTTGITYGGTTGVNVNLATGTSDYDTSDAENPLGTLVSIEQVNGTAGNDSFVGGDPAHAPDFLGNRDAEVFRPLGGDDTITGATGNGFFTRVDYSTNTNMQAVSVNLGTGTASDGFGFTDTLVRIDEVIGGAGNDSLLGGGQERGSGGGFREVFRGNSGNDTIDGAGTDTVVGAAGNDRVQYNSSPAAVIVNLMSGTASDGFGFTDTLFNIDEVQGSNFNDTLTGGGEDHRLIGGAGNDSLVGGTSGVEASYIGGTPAGVNANLALGTASDGFGFTDTLVNIDDLRGSDFSDTLTGSAASNIIIGEPGADIIDGGGGIDFASYASTPLANGGINALIANGSGAVNDGMGSIDTLSNIEGLIGTHSNDTLTGGLGDQWFRGRGGNDSINGGTGNDWVSYIDDPAGVTVDLGTGTAMDGWGGVWGFGGIDTLTSIENVEGSQFSDSLTGDANANVIEGGAGNDTIKGGAGDDTLTGGEGIDTLSYDDSPSRVIVNMFVNNSITIGGITVDPGHAFDGFGPPIPLPPTDTIGGFETVIGSAFSDFIQGSTNVSNLLVGGTGNDTLAGSGSNDGIMPPLPGAANDTLLGGAGNDVLRQSRGNDIIDGGEGSSDALNFLNNGIVYGGAIGVNVNLEAGTSDADPNDGDGVHGAGGDVSAISGIERVDGTAGNDSLVGGDPTHAPDSLGNGILESFLPLGGNDTITGAIGDGFITRAEYSSNTAGQAVIVNLGATPFMVGMVTVQGGTAHDGFGGTDTLVRVDQAFGGSGNDTLLGGSQERSNAGIFLEQFRGGAGNDEINGAGTDTVVGAAGTNQVRYSDSPAAVIVNLGATDFVAGMVTVQGGTARDGFIADTVTGAQFTDTLLNINSVLGSNFNDTLVGGASDHRLIGGPGNDLLVGGTSGVEASYNNGTTAVNVNLATGFVSDGQGGSDTLVNIDDLRGSIFNDTLTGNAASNRILGDPGADTIDGGDGIDFASYLSTSLANGGINAFIENGAGLVNDGFGLGSDTLSNIEGLIGTHSNDTLAGGLGDQWFIGRGGSDVINGGDGSDGVSYINDPAGVTVNLGAPGSATDGWGGVWGLQGTDTLNSIENVEGSQFNDSITGDAFANRLEGQGGNDTLEGGGGADTMTGSTGMDTFKFNATSDSSTALAFSDVITDFVHATDKIDLSAIDANTGVDSDQAFAFVELANANTVANSVTWSEDVPNIRTILHIDNNGDATADMQIVLHGTGLGLTDTDLIL